MFDSAQWNADCPQFSEVLNRAPHFSLLHPLALENPRALPQQALSTLSTVDDIESYLTEVGAIKGREYLRVIDLPYSERAAVLGDLRMMGVTAASLFPGIDGTCEALRMDLFEE